ncbi:CapA family protein [Nocardia sp. CDC153]|uniref:CapA family protein n=1 Tax=Nocardia sp. CDC153 TaxID=3112167 RepID=UPI002DB84D5D|nr:CapA family protein [Nocardia sp. CDC153]MEC3956923.1 CapA family protein [Nocardia sp. CDC153]
MFGGDVNVQRRSKPTEAFAGIRDTLTKADFRFVNLEGPLCGDGPVIPHKPNWTHADPAMVEALTWAGIDVVSCANNVTFPAWATLASLEVLDRAGIAHCGGSRREQHRASSVWRNRCRLARGTGGHLGITRDRDHCRGRARQPPLSWLGVSR